MPEETHPVRIAVYGCGRFANRTHIPNILRQQQVEIVALCDVNEEALKQTAETFNISRIYQDAHEMLITEQIDALYSVVPAFVRSDVEATAASKGIHLFSEKPQALTMMVANRIDQAIREANVISTVGFRERYRPIFQKARDWLVDKEVIHVRFQQVGDLPPQTPAHHKSWFLDLEKSGGWPLDWGVHATDYARFMTGLNVARVQAFYHQSPDYPLPLSAAFNYQLSNGASMTLNFIAATPTRPPNEPWFTIFYEGGYLAVYRYDRLESNGQTVYRAEPFDPWLEQDRTFIEAVRSGDASTLLSDYHDGLYSLAPILAGWQSSRRNGDSIDVAKFINGENA